MNHNHEVGRGTENLHYTIMPFLQAGGEGTPRAMAKHFRKGTGSILKWLDLLELEGLIIKKQVYRDGITVTLTTYGKAWKPETRRPRRDCKSEPGHNPATCTHCRWERAWDRFNRREAWTASSGQRMLS